MNCCERCGNVIKPPFDVVCVDCAARSCRLVYDGSTGGYVDPKDIVDLINKGLADVKNARVFSTEQIKRLMEEDKK